MASHRPLAAAVAWLALFAGAAPAWGCAVTALQSDCCPDGTSLPCPGNEPDSSSAEFANACCAAAPSQAAAAPQTAARADHEAPADDDSPDGLALSAAATAEAEVSARHAQALSFMAAPLCEAAPIYLRTSRLRL